MPVAAASPDPDDSLETRIREMLAAQPDYPLLALPTVEAGLVLAAQGEAGMQQLTEILEMRQGMIHAANDDPIRCGHALPSWQRADRLLDEIGAKELTLFGGNRAAKTEYCARTVVKILLEKPGARAWCFHENQKVSRSQQQSRVYKFLPPEIRNLGARGKFTKISYRQATGFSEDTFVLPNRSQCWFMFYSASEKQIEGEELDIAWCDELVPLKVLQTLRFRLATREGLLLVSFTPMDGLTPTVREIITGAEAVEKVPAIDVARNRTDGSLRYLPRSMPDLVKPDEEDIISTEAMPLVEKCRREDAYTVYFHTHENPFGNPREVLKKCDLFNLSDVKVRFFGVTAKTMGNLFPKFRRDIHVVDRAKIRGPGTWYHVVDPCNGRNFFMIWIWVNALGQRVVAREWPQMGDYIPTVGAPGPWAEVDQEKLDGKPGPAQQPWGLTLEEMRAEIERVEKELADPLYREGVTTAEREAGRITIAERYMDSRFGNTPTLAKSENLTLIEAFEDLELDFLPAPGEHEKEGITAVNNALGGYDPNQPIGPGNSPELFISRDCGNVIWTLENYTGKDGPKGASKDVADVLRYAELAELEYLEDGAMNFRQGPQLGRSVKS